MVLGSTGDRRFLGVWAAARETLFQPVGHVAAHFLDGDSPATGAAQTPNIDDVRPAQKPCFKNPSAKATPEGPKLDLKFTARVRALAQVPLRSGPGP